jgi:excisionase family DNA binding protein
MAKKIAQNEINALQFYSPKEVAERLNVNYRTIVRNIHAGNIVATKLSGVYRISGKEFLRLLNQ